MDSRKDDLVQRIRELASGVPKLTREAVRQYIKSSAATTLMSTRTQRLHTSTRIAICGMNKTPKGLPVKEI